MAKKGINNIGLYLKRLCYRTNNICATNQIKIILGKKCRLKKRFLPKTKWPLYENQNTHGRWNDRSPLSLLLYPACHLPQHKWLECAYCISMWDIGETHEPGKDLFWSQICQIIRCDFLGKARGADQTASLTQLIICKIKQILRL